MLDRCPCRRGCLFAAQLDNSEAALRELVSNILLLDGLKVTFARRLLGELTTHELSQRRRVVLLRKQDLSDLCVRLDLQVYVIVEVRVKRLAE